MGRWWNRSFRSLVIACVSTGILPSIQTLGPLATEGIAAVVAYIGFACVLLHFFFPALFPVLLPLLCFAGTVC